MKENTKRFFRNSLLSVLGFLLAIAVIVLSVQFGNSALYTRIASGVILAVTAVGMFFYGYKVLKPLKSAWQTVLSVDVLPVAVLLILSVFLGLVFETNDIPAALLIIPSYPFLELFPASADPSELAINLIVFLTPFFPFLCMTVGAAVRRQREKGEL